MASWRIRGGTSGRLAAEQEKVLQSMRRHWQGLTVFVDDPQVPMDNNAAYAARGISEAGESS
jgi:hypothetical protein